MKKNNKYILSGILGLVLVGSLAAQQVDIFFLIKKNFSIFSKSYETVALEYVDEVDPEKLMRTGLNAMLETLDPYTVLYDESQMEQAEILSTGNYAGIGVEVGFRDGKAVIIAPTPEGPAYKKGIKAGDIIVAIDGVSVEDLQPDQIQELTVGEVGSDILLTIKRPLVESFLNFDLTRERIDIKNITYSGVIDESNKIGYIKLAQFGENSAEEVRVALKKLVDEDGINGLVIDLRDNPGGILQESVAIIDKFVEPGLTVVETKGRIAQYNQLYPTSEPVFFDKPVTVLINGGSASASEIVAGALQDLDRAVVMGEQSFGKGLVQIVKPMPYNTRMKITISKYYIPSGRSIQSIDYLANRNGELNENEIQLKEFSTRNGRKVFEGRGIEPDIEVKSDNLSLLQTALLQRGSYFDFATQFYSKNPDLNFTSLPNTIINDFRNFLDDSGFSYKTDEEDLLEQLSGHEKLSEENESIEKLNSLVERNKVAAFQNEAELIKQNLYLEILSRYKTSEEKTEAQLAEDNLVQRAIEILSSQSEFQKLLGIN